MQTGNLDLGRKIFFLNPPAGFQDSIIPMLATAGYEIYILTSYKHAKPILKEYSNSVFFICIDTELLIDQWYNFVSSFSHDKIFSDLIIGIMSTYAGEKEKNHFLLNAAIPGGFVSLSQNEELIHDYLHSILNINEARGRRNFVRADCSCEKDVSVEYEIKGYSLSFNISNISSAGMLCVTSAKMQPLFTNTKNLNSIIIKLKSKLLQTNVTLYRTYVENEQLFLVLLFSQDLSYSARLIIDTYVRNLLQERIDMKVRHLSLDCEEYMQRQKSAIGDDSEDAFLIEEGDK